MSTHYPVCYHTGAGHEMGVGHLKRGLALMPFLKDKEIQLTFALHGDESAEGLLKKKGAPFRTLPSLSGEKYLEEIVFHLREHGCRLLVTDIPFCKAPQRYRETIRKEGLYHLVIDDLLRAKIFADVVINSSPVLLSPPPSHGRYFQGSHLMILEKSYALRRGRWIEKEVRSILISCGGSDPMGLSERILDALARIHFPGRVHLVIGPAFRGKETVEERLRAKDIELTLHYNPPDLTHLLSEADLAIISGGITLYEALSLGTPAIVLCQNAEQYQVTGAFARAGCCVNLGLGNNVEMESLIHALEKITEDHGWRQEISLRGPHCVDGLGGERIARIIAHLLN